LEVALHREEVAALAAHVVLDLLGHLDPLERTEIMAMTDNQEKPAPQEKTVPHRHQAVLQNNAKNAHPALQALPAAQDRKDRPVDPVSLAKLHNLPAALRQALQVLPARQDRTDSLVDPDNPVDQDKSPKFPDKQDLPGPQDHLVNPDRLDNPEDPVPRAKAPLAQLEMLAPLETPEERDSQEVPETMVRLDQAAAAITALPQELHRDINFDEWRIYSSIILTFEALRMPILLTVYSLRPQSNIFIVVQKRLEKLNSN